MLAAMIRSTPRLKVVVNKQFEKLRTRLGIFFWIKKIAVKVSGPIYISDKNSSLNVDMYEREFIALRRSESVTIHLSKIASLIMNLKAVHF